MATAGRGGAVGHGKSGAPLTRGCFLLVLTMMTAGVVVETSTLTTSRLPNPSLGVVNVRFRGARSAFMHPTATSFSPPLRNNNDSTGRRTQNLGGGSISSSLMPPGVASRAPGTRTQESGPTLSMLTPPQPAPRPHTWAAGSASHPKQSTFVAFGADAASAPRSAKHSHPQDSEIASEGGVGWAGMDAPSSQGRGVSMSAMTHPRAHLTAELSDSVPSANPSRLDTFGLRITEDLSHISDGRPSERRQVSKPRFSSRGEGGPWTREGPQTRFRGGFPKSRLWPTGVDEEEMVVEDEGVESILDLNPPTEYQREDYITYHDYDQGNHHSWRSEHMPPATQDHKPLTFQNIIEIMSLASQADLHALLENRNITFDKLRDFLNNGARKEDVLEFLKPQPPLPTLTTTSSLELEHPAPEASLVEEGYQDDVRGRASASEGDQEGEGDNIQQHNKEQTKRNRKNRRRGKGERRKNKGRKKKKGQRENVPDIAPSPIPPMDNTSLTVDPEPWVPSTLETLPDIPLVTTAATGDTLLPTTQPSASDTVGTLPSSVKASEVSIVSVTLLEAPSDPSHKTPDHTTLVEDATPTKRHNTHHTTPPWEHRTPRKFPRPATPSREPEQTVNEIEKVNFVREEQRDDYVFPLRGLLIISGLMGALAVFTLVVLISYAIIKCSKKPVVNNYQVSEQQKPAGT